MTDKLIEYTIKPGGGEMRRLVLLVKHGYDFDPTTALAVCSSKEKAQELATGLPTPLPWNSHEFTAVEVDRLIDWEAKFSGEKR